MLDRITEGYLEGTRTQVVRGNDPATQANVWTFRGTPPSPPVAVSLLIGDILYNLRSALDHLVWQLVVANGTTLTELESAKVEFPIFDDATKYASAIPAKLKGVAIAAQAIIESLQPFSGRGHLELWILHQLNNVDKHRHLHLTLFSTHTGGWNFTLPAVGPIPAPNPYVGEVHDGTELLRMPANQLVEFHPQFDLSFDQNAPIHARDGEVRNLLCAIASEVDSVINQRWPP